MDQLVAIKAVCQLTILKRMPATPLSLVVAYQMQIIFVKSTVLIAVITASPGEKNPLSPWVIQEKLASDHLQ